MWHAVASGERWGSMKSGGTVDEEALDEVDDDVSRSCGIVA